jgi:hypothetical protein
LLELQNDSNTVTNSLIEKQKSR